MGAKIEIWDFLGVFDHGESESDVCLGLGVISALLRQTPKKPDFCHFLPFLAIFAKVWSSLSRKRCIFSEIAWKFASKKFSYPLSFLSSFEWKWFQSAWSAERRARAPFSSMGRKMGGFFRISPRIPCWSLELWMSDWFHALGIYLIYIIKVIWGELDYSEKSYVPKGAQKAIFAILSNLSKLQYRCWNVVKTIFQMYWTAQYKIISKISVWDRTG